MLAPQRRAVAGTVAVSAALVAGGAILAMNNAAGQDQAPLTAAVPTATSTPTGTTAPAPTLGTLPLVTPTTPATTGASRSAGTATATAPAALAHAAVSPAAAAATAATVATPVTQAASVAAPVPLSTDARVAGLTVSGSAATDFSSGAGLALAQQLVLLTLDHGMTGAAMAAAGQVPASQVAMWTQVMDATGQERLNRLVTQAGAGSEAVEDRLFPIISTDVATEYDSRLSFVDDPAARVGDQSVGTITATRGANANNAVLGFATTTVYHLQLDTGARYAFTTLRTSSFQVRRTGGAWLVRGWHNKDRVTGYVAESAGAPALTLTGPGATGTTSSGLVGTSARTGTLAFSRWVANPAGVDDQATRDGLNREYITVANGTNTTVSLTGYTISDVDGVHLFSFPAGFSLAPRSWVEIHSGQGTPTAGKLFWGQYVSGEGYAARTGMVWNNDGDTATLRDARGVVVDQCTYQSNSTGQAIC